MKNNDNDQTAILQAEDEKPFEEKYADYLKGIIRHPAVPAKVPQSKKNTVRNWPKPQT